MRGSHRVRLLLVCVLTAVVGMVGCGSSVDQTTPTCAEGEVQIKDRCEPQTSAKPDVCEEHTDCDDGSSCTTNDRCINAVCFYTNACDDGDPGTDDVCTNWQSGACSHTDVGETSGGSTSVSSSSATGGSSCVPEANEDGGVYVVLTVQLSPAQGTNSTFNNDWNGSWPNAASYTNTTSVVIQGMMTPGVHVANASLGDGKYLVEGMPSVHLSVAEASVTASFGGCPAVTPELLSKGESFPGYSVRYAWRNGEQGPNLLFCQSATSCAVSVF